MENCTSYVIRNEPAQLIYSSHYKFYIITEKLSNVVHIHNIVLVRWQCGTLAINKIKMIGTYFSTLFKPEIFI